MGLADPLPIGTGPCPGRPVKALRVGKMLTFMQQLARAQAGGENKRAG